MTRRFVLIFSLLCCFINTKSQIPLYRVNWDYQDQSFIDFVNKAESAYPVKFFFNEEWIKELKLENRGTGQTIDGILENAFRDKNIYFSRDDKGNIILTRNYSIKTFNPGIEKEVHYLPANDYSQSESTLKVNQNILIQIGNPQDRTKSGNAIISGYVRAKESGELLTGVAIYFMELSRGTITNEFGYYSISIPRGNFTIRYSMMGMKEIIYKAKIFGSGKLDIEMTETLIPLGETIITADKNSVLHRFEVGLEKINMRTVKLMPTSMGEVDVLKSMLLIPGVKTVGEGSTGFNVRGGAADQNLILLYGSPLFNTSHFFGFFSAVNSDIIKDVLLYKGGIPAQYGGRISSVIDIIPRDGNKERFRGNAGISPVTSHLTIETPLIKNKMSLILSARTTYSNWVLRLVENQALRNSQASFYDLNGRIAYDVNSNNRIELSSYFSHDSFKFNTDTTYNYDNRIFSLQWRHSFTDNFIMQFSTSSSLYNFSVISKRNPETASVFKHYLDYSAAKTDFNVYGIENHRLNFGAELIRYKISPGATYPFNDSSLVSPRIIENENAYESSLYAGDRINLTSRLSINIGLRYSLFSAIGPKTVWIYAPGHPLSESTVTDTLNVGQGRAYKTYHGPEYRVSLNFLLTSMSSVKLNYNRTRQYLHMLSNTTSISPTDTWKLSDYYFEPQVGDQYSAGYYLTFPEKGVELSAELYYKSIRNMVDFKGGATLTMNEYLEREIVNVKGMAYGIELFLKKSLGNVSLNIGYNYSRTLLRSNTPYDNESINSGQWFPASYDKPNDLNIAYNYTVTRRLSFSLNYTYSTGRPVTYPVVVYKNAGLWIVEYSDRNKFRLPDYSRFDFSARLGGNLKSRKLINPYWTFSLYNVFGRDNVYSVYFVTDGNTVKGYQLSVFANPIPTLTYSFDF